MRKEVNKNARVNFFVLLFVFVFLIGIVMAASPIWDIGFEGTIFEFLEEEDFFYNFSNNVSDSDGDDLSFSITTGGVSEPIVWIYDLTKTKDFFYWIFWNDTLDRDSSDTGVLGFDINSDNETGRFNVSVDSSDGESSAGARTFFFYVNATNDYPNFTLGTKYSSRISLSENKSENITLVGSDEEEHYPLVYNVSFNSCIFASWSTRTPGICDLDYLFYNISNTTSILGLENLSYNDIGSYNLTICATDNVNATTPPFYRSLDYDENKTTCYNTTLDLSSALSIDSSDCDGTNWTEGNTLNCTINITTIFADDIIDFLSVGNFKADSGPSESRQSWFYPNTNLTATNYLISIPISIVLGKEEVGNWTIALSADDSHPDETPRPVYENISIFVNYTESPVNILPISDLTGVNALYESQTFNANITDEDLLIWDNSIKKESFVVASNVSWVSVTVSNAGDSSYPYRLASVYVNHTGALNDVGEGNFSVRINVTDSGDNYDDEDFVVEVVNDTAPVWDLSLDNPVNLSLLEDNEFFYNFSLNVTDVEGDPISFYYQDLSSSFCSLNSTNFASDGIIDFMPRDCDVGYHNVTIIASDGKLNSSHQFNFTVSNVVDVPNIASLNSSVVATESESGIIDFQVNDDDYLIPASQSFFYEENLTVNFTIENLTEVTTLVSFEFISSNVILNTEYFNATFTPTAANVGYYNITVNVSDSSGAYDVSYFTLNVSAVNDAPVIEFFSNQSTTVFSEFYLDINATDEEDDSAFSLLNYTIENLTVGGDFLDINLTTGVINFTMNESFAGYYLYNVTVNDSDGAIDSQVFSLKVHGVPNITSPISGYQFSWKENVLNSSSFEVYNAINSTNLTYEFYMDRIVYEDFVNYSYSNLSLRYSENFTWINESNFTWNFVPDFSDETYNHLKNVTLFVYNPEYPELNDSQNWKVNISHTNENISFSGFVLKQGPVTVGSVIQLNLSQYFSDADATDNGILQQVNFTIVTNSNSTNNVELGSVFDGWILNLSSSVAVAEIIKIVAQEYNSSGISIGNATSNEFEVEFIAPTTVTVPRSTTSTVTKLQYFSLKLIVPQDIILKDKKYIEVPFSLQNTGTVALNGISLSSDVLFNNAFSDDISIELEDTYIESLAVGQIENYTLKVFANTEQSGRYKVTVRANVTSPKFSDWGDFFIDLQKTNETETEQILIFTEQFITDNPECLELTEVLNRAKEAYVTGDSVLAISLADQVTRACEDAIKKTNQVRYNVEGFVQNNFYYILFITLSVFVAGFVIYVYKRVRFNKVEGDYILR